MQGSWAEFIPTSRGRAMVEPSEREQEPQCQQHPLWAVGKKLGPKAFVGFFLSCYLYCQVNINSSFG